MKTQFGVRPQKVFQMLFPEEGLAGSVWAPLPPNSFFSIKGNPFLAGRGPASKSPSSSDPPPSAWANKGMSLTRLAYATRMGAFGSPTNIPDICCATQALMENCRQFMTPFSTAQSAVVGHCFRGGKFGPSHRGDPNLAKPEPKPEPKLDPEPELHCARDPYGRPAAQPPASPTKTASCSSNL